MSSGFSERSAASLGGGFKEPSIAIKLQASGYMVDGESSARLPIASTVETFHGLLRSEYPVLY